MSYDWNANTLLMLKTMWQDGYSASQVADRLPGKITRNAVLGKIHRMNIAARSKVKQPCQRRIGDPKRSAPRKQVLTPTAIKRPISVAFPISCNPTDKLTPQQLPLELDLIGVSTADHKDCMCSWIKNDPRNGAIWCPETKLPGKSYCGAHLSRAVPPIVPRRPTAPSFTTAAITASRSLREVVNA